MTSGYEFAKTADHLTPERALQHGIELGLLDAVNLERYHDRELANMPHANHPGVIVPALRRAEDFEVGEEVWFFDPATHSCIHYGAVATIFPEENCIFTAQRMAYRGFMNAAYYGLWRMRDLERIHELKAEHKGTGYYSPFGYIATIERAANPASDELLLKLIRRKLTY